MRRLARWAAAAVVVVAVLLLGAWVTLRRLYPPERIRAMALERIERALGRKVKIASVSIGLRGVDLEKLAISNAPDFAAGTFLEAGRLAARWDLAALLHRKVSISEVVLSDFDCRLVQDAHGRLNIPSTAPAAQPASGERRTRAPEPAPAASAGGPAPKEPLEVSVRRVQVQGGRVSFQPAAGSPIVVDDVQATVSDFRPGAEFPASFSFRYKAGENQGTVDFRGAVTLAEDGGAHVRFDTLKLQRGDVALELAGKADRQPSGRVSLSAKGTVPSFSGAGLALDGSLTPPAGKGPTRVDMTVRATAVPLQSLAAFSSAIAEYKVRGSAALDVHAGGTTDAPVLSGTGRLDSLSASLSGLPLTDGALDLSFDPRKASVRGAAKLSGSALNLDVQALDYAAAPDVRVNARLASLDLSSWTPTTAPAAKTPAPAPPARGSAPSGRGKTTPAAPAKAPASPPVKTSGHVEIGPIKHPQFHADSARADWSLAGVTPDLGRLSGKAALRVGPGRFEDLKELVAKSTLARVALLPLTILQKVGGVAKIPLLPAFDKVTFKEITGDYAFQNGLMTVRESHMDSSAGYVTTSGTADLARDQLNLRIADKFGATPIALTVRGTTAQPQVKVDMASVLKQPGVNQAIEQGRKLLQGIFKR